MKFKYCVIHQLVLSGSLIFPTLSFADSDSTKTTPNKASYLEEISVVATTVQHIFSSTQSTEQLRKKYGV